MNKVIIIGAGQYGEVYAEYLSDSNKYEILGFLDDDSNKHGKSINKYKVLGALSYLNSIENKDKIAIFAPIGSNKDRVRILKHARSLGFHTPCYIHPSVNIHHSVKFGKSVYILPSSNIMPFTKIDDNVMISMNVNIAHHTHICEGTFISQGSSVGASVTINDCVFLGISSTIMTGVKSIGENSTIGAGSVVIRNIPNNSIVAGVPAKIIKQKNAV